MKTCRCKNEEYSLKIYLFKININLKFKLYNLKF